MQEVTIYTDGGCHGNPGPGGYGAVLLSGQHRKELSAGYKRTTNNRMELLACITALETLKQPCRVTLHSDSKYIVDSITKGWARRWQANDWRRNQKEKAINPDLWARLLDLCERHEVQFIWVKGHAGNKENERCDSLVQAAIARNNLKEDANYVRHQTASSLFDASA